LQEALNAVQKTREDGYDGTNKLVIDIYLLNQDELDRCQYFQTLASICKDINVTFSAKNRDYPWFSGGEGPTFAFRVEERVPHLRAYCWYGSSIADEWTAVAAMIEISRDRQLENCAVEMWDSDDGEGIPLLLIESAMALPRWVDEIGPAACKHRCWLVDGEILLIQPNLTGSQTNNIKSQLSLSKALQHLHESTCVEKLARKALQVVEKRLAPYLGFGGKTTATTTSENHRSAVLLPRQVAYLLENIPSMCQCAVASFEQNSYLRKPPGDQIEFHDLVWTTQRMGKTSYAILRNLTSQHWPSLEGEGSIPAVYKSVEVNRMKRMCQMESTPHLKYALQLGIRITAGLEYMINFSPKQKTHDNTPSFGAEELILKYWTSLDVACGGDGAWLRDAWLAGPNNSPVNLSNLIACPIESIDLKPSYRFPKTHRQKDVKKIVKENLRKKQRKEHDFIVPSSDEVDDESWMQIKSIEENYDDTILPRLDEEGTPGNAEEQVDELLGNFKSFVSGKSDIEGIASGTKEPSTMKDIDDGSLDIDPKLVLSLLHKVLNSTPEEIQNLTTEDDDIELYFGKDDSSLEDGSENDDIDEPNKMKALMEAMDLELNLESIGKDIVDGDEVCDEKLVEEAGVISNLLESLEASEGAAGPVRNIIGEMKSYQNK